VALIAKEIAMEKEILKSIIFELKECTTQGVHHSRK